MAKPVIAKASATIVVRDKNGNIKQIVDTTPKTKEHAVK